MSQLRALRIRLGLADVGTLFDLDDGRVYFQFDDEYALDPQRANLSVLLSGGTEEQVRAQLIKPPDHVRFGGGKRRLPVFFRNLLPEGVLRKQLIADAGIDVDDEMSLLSYCGEDLPGDVWALPEKLDDARMRRLLTQGHDSFEYSSDQLPTPQAVSLSGVQPKVDLVQAAGGRYVMRSSTASGGAHFIAKLPASDYQGLPEVEHTSLLLAAAAGVRVCQAQLQPLSAIADKLPFTLRDDARNFLLVRRFDRDAPTPTGRLHMEDFAQALGLSPEDKYQGDYASIGLVLLEVSPDGAADVLELLRRVKVNELLGNYDAHTKNFSLLYGLDGKARLSPAYDIVAYGAYIDGQGHGLRFLPGQTGKRVLTPSIVRQLANIWELPEIGMTAVLRDTVDRAMRTWPGMIMDSALSQAQKTRLIAHLDDHPDAHAWRRRNKLT
ncbi:type II toxin-antitoxin system HipA family toxin [Lacisediminimonas sp.]|uniref:type II toxin-antitoxin system HipA family toxin n=1 Tax=Lacisediminimonas sp. TaxID=3060582 RepID=UPI002722DD16|nr:type II toxin-antitoxin system HipA family toxin [Lacisediminimonas sp.]MDO8300904.1 type II toxin-antitoxin system HipA family toxin [Lacisediminimonas sp.]